MSGYTSKPIDPTSALVTQEMFWVKNMAHGQYDIERKLVFYLL